MKFLSPQILYLHLLLRQPLLYLVALMHSRAAKPSTVVLAQNQAQTLSPRHRVTLHRPKIDCFQKLKVNFQGKHQVPLLPPYLLILFSLQSPWQVALQAIIIFLPLLMTVIQVVEKHQHQECPALRLLMFHKRRHLEGSSHISKTSSTSRNLKVQTNLLDSLQRFSPFNFQQQPPQYLHLASRRPLGAMDPSTILALLLSGLYLLSPLMARVSSCRQSPSIL